MSPVSNSQSSRFWRALVLIAFACATIALIPSLVGLYLVQEQLDAQEQLRRERAALTSRTDRLICERSNAERDIVADVIRSVIAANATEARRRRSAEFFAEALERLEPDECGSLPSAQRLR